MRVPVGVKVGVFALAVMGSYSYFANSIPQIESKPPQELSLEGGQVTTAQLVKAGEEIFKTKGTCEVCHRIGQKGTRAPDLAGVGSRATARAADRAAEVKLPGDPKAGEAIFAGKGGCIACHKAGKVGAAQVGPDLSQIAKIQTPDYIMKKILDPAGMGTVAGYPKGVMPPTFGQTLTAREYTDLVSFLLTLK